MAYTYRKSRFRPRRPVRSFRDLEVYQKALEGAVAITKNVFPILSPRCQHCQPEVVEQVSKGQRDNVSLGRASTSGNVSLGRASTSDNVGSGAAYPLRDEMIKCALNIPVMIAEAHSSRFEDKMTGLELLNKAMAESNKIVVYLEQVRDIYMQELDRVLIEELIKKYVYNRRKIFNLYKAWQRFLEKDKESQDNLI